MSKLLNGHIQEESAATLLDAAVEQAPNKDAPDAPSLSPPPLSSSSVITEGDPSVIPPEHPYRTLVLWQVVEKSLTVQATINMSDFAVLMELVISSMKTCVLRVRLDSIAKRYSEFEYRTALYPAEEGR